MKGARTPAASSEERRLVRKARRHRDRRSDVLRAARELLVTSGVQNFTMAAVAAAAAVTKPALYYYFGSKEALVSALALEVFAVEVEALTRAVDEAPDGLAALEAMVRAYVSRYIDDLDAFRLLNLVPQIHGIDRELLEREVYPKSAQINGALERKLEQDRQLGKLHPDVRARQLANVAWVTAHGLVSLASSLDAVQGNTRFTIDDLCDEACQNLVRGAERR